MKRRFSVLILICYLLLLAGCYNSGQSATISSGLINTPSVSASDASASRQSASHFPSSGSSASKSPASADSNSTPKYELAQVFSERYDSYGMRQRDMYVLTNTGNQTLYITVRSFDYENQDGHLVDVATLYNVTPNIVKPGEHSYIFADNSIKDEYLNEQIVSKLNINVELAQVECIRYEVSDLTISVGESTDRLEAIGRVKNSTNQTTDTFYYVDIVVFDENGMPLDVIDAMLNDDLKPGETISFQASTMYNFVTSIGQIDRYEIYAYPLQYQF